MADVCYFGGDRNRGFGSDMDRLLLGKLASCRGLANGGASAGEIDRSGQSKVDFGAAISDR